MKSSYIKYAIALAVIIGGIIFICAGCSSAPTRFEQGLFNIHTNTYEVVVVKTNVVPVYQTNTIISQVTLTNTVSPGPPKVETVYVTNQVVVVSQQTNVVAETSKVEDYQYTPGDKAKAITETAGAVGGIFGVGGLVTTGLTALWGLWAQLRSRKNYWTSAALAQNVQALREFVKQLPQGAAYDSAFKQWMTTHQADAGVLQQVLSLLASEVDQGEAKETVQALQRVVEAIRTAPTAPTPGQPGIGV